MPGTIFQRITKYNAGRDDDLLAMKLKLLGDNVFSFYRGTCHLFYEDWPKNSSLNQAPVTWICGDLHLENFGSYKGDNRLTYFDFSDFDESVLAPCTWELARVLVSIYVAADSLQLKKKEAPELCDAFLESYINALKQGSPQWVERANAKGMVKELLVTLKKRVRGDFIKNRTEIKGNKTRLLLSKTRALAVSDEARTKVTNFMAEYAKTRHNPAFFEVLDLARRVAGTGSLGVERYAILVRGLSKKPTQLDKLYLLDLKASNSSALAPYLPKDSQPQWASPATRIVTSQRNMQAMSPAFLNAVNIGKQSYVLKELLPTQDRLSLVNANGDMSRLKPVVKQMGEITAWSQLRASGRQGAAVADDLIDFGHTAEKWRKPLLDYVQQYADQVKSDWKAFCKDTDS
jgi:uncharacterized protein (DUF2252 family)